MLSDADIDYLVDASKSAVKRYGGDGPSLTHLALVLTERWQGPFEDCFGTDGRDAMRRLAKYEAFVGAEQDIRDVLATEGDKAAVLAELHRRLAAVLDEHGTEAVESSTAQTPGGGLVETGAAAAGEDEPPQATEWPKRTQRFLQRVEPRSDLIGRDLEVEELEAAVLRSRGGIPAVVGMPGTGRTALLGGLVQALGASAAPELTVWRIGANSLGSSPEGVLSRILEDCEQPAVLCLDDFTEVAALGTAHPDIGFLHTVRAATFHEHARLVIVCDSRYLGRLGVHVADLAERLVPVSVGALSGAALDSVVESSLEGVAAVHGVEISADLRAAVVAPRRSKERCAHPGLALDRLDAAASRAAAAGDSTATAVHLLGAEAVAGRRRTASEVAAELNLRVRGQAHAVDAVTSRLALTLARLDLRPERPDGVFLFVGPTGVGKTELARAMSEIVFGSEDRLIRLDMSEYAHDWAVSRLVGPMPGYVGSTEPETWLTTRVTEKPDCVLLLDEIEKAHPTVWNTFLQVFDAGRLTDARGVVADFSNVVIVMTSNMGAAKATSPGLGFAPGEGAQVARDRMVRTVRETMAPELINRIDEIAVFDPLTMSAITEIAQRELDRACTRLAVAGWRITFEPNVPIYLAEHGYDPAFGARHLQRNIERLFLGLIARSESNALAISVASDGRSLEATSLP